jgi:glycopeptide antibiotics resistance protein
LAFSNIGGNLILFLPMGFFLPALFAELRRSRLCLFVIFCLILAAELLQGVFRVGIPDIDDLTVNMLGAYVGFLLSKKFIFKHAVS